MSELSLGTNGALIFFFKTDYQLSFSNHGWSFSYFVEAWPSRLAGSLCSNRFRRSCSFGENFITSLLLLTNQGFYKLLPRKAPSCFSFWRAGSLWAFNEAGIRGTTNLRRWCALFFWWFLGRDILECHRWRWLFIRWWELWRVQSLWVWCTLRYRWWYFLVLN